MTRERRQPPIGIAFLRRSIVRRHPRHACAHANAGRHEQEIEDGAHETNVPEFLGSQNTRQNEIENEGRNRNGSEARERIDERSRPRRGFEDIGAV